MSNDELRAKTKEIQKYVQDYAKEEKAKIAELKAKIEDTPIDEREGIFNQIDKLEKEALDKYEVALNEVLPTAFSIVKDTARRFAENEETVVTATDFDRELASDPKNDFVTIDGDKAIYHNHWTAGGNDMKWEMIHYDVQLFGGVVLHQGKIAEMATGEGKTLVGTCPVFLNALTGNGVHVVTVNDYLAKRDSEWMGPLYMFNGLSVDCIDKHRPNSDERRKAYMADITFGTNNEFGFDYLRDNMATNPSDLVQRQHNYAIVDEVDSVLIDDARTPLIISGPIPKGDDQMFEQYQPLVERLYEVQRKQATELLAEAKQVNDKELFVLPDITTEMSELEARTDLSDQERLDKKDEMLAHYGVQSERVHTLQQLLKAYTMFNNNDEYVVMDGQVKIVDEQTGRIMEGRRWSDGLHQAIEAKEHVKVEAATQTFATITLQNYFRMYHKLSGMTGTASTEAGEFWDIYKLDVVEIPTNRPIARKDLDDRVYKTAREKYRAVIDEIVEMRDAGRPVLVGTTSVEISELLSKMLKMRNIPHNVLNAKLHQQEAQIVAEAGRSVNGKGAVTIATNMAGRGTDIKLTPEVKAAGGLAIIGTERHESRRVDRQLRGRAGRQGDPGSSVFYVSLEDKLMRLFASERIAKVMDRLGFEDGERIESPMISKSIERAQRKVEENNFGIRKHLLEYDDVMNRQRTVIYEKRRHALMGERIGMDIANIIWDRVLNIVNNNDFAGAKEEFLKILAMEIPFTEDEYENGSREDLAERAFQEAMAAFKRKTDRIQATAYPIIKQVYENQGQMYKNIMVPLTDGKRMYNIPCNLEEAYTSEAKNVVKEFEKAVVLHIIDDDWKENLRKLDELRHSVQNASYEQKDPLLIFKLESAKIWDAMINDMYDRIASILMRGQIPVMEQEQPVQEAAPEQPTQQNYVESKVDIDAERAAQEAAANQDTREGAEVNRTPYRAERMPRPNDPCPCGSGKKFKNCHGRNL